MPALWIVGLRASCNPRSLTPQRRATTDHAVDAGAVAWSFDLPLASADRHAYHGGPHNRSRRRRWRRQRGPSISRNPRSRIHSQPAPQSGLSTRSRSTLPRSQDSGPGSGRLDYQGDLFEGGGRAVGVGEIELVSGNPDRRLTITLSSIPPSVRAEFLQDVGAVEVEVSLIYSADRGDTWRAAPLSYSGRLSSPTMVNGRLNG